MISFCLLSLLCCSSILKICFEMRFDSPKMLICLLPCKDFTEMHAQHPPPVVVSYNSIHHNTPFPSSHTLLSLYSPLCLQFNVRLDLRYAISTLSLNKDGQMHCFGAPKCCRKRLGRPKYRTESVCLLFQPRPFYSICFNYFL